MSKKVNTVTIGLFIVSGVALGVIGLLLFSSSKLFTRTQDEIVYFDNSLNGLNEGAPVKYRGVTIGSVKRVMIHFNQAPNDYALPVILEIDKKLLTERLGDESVQVFTPDAMERDVRNGLRATLQTESLVTGVLFVGLDFAPHATPPVLHQLKRIYVEVPSEPTDVQKLMTNLASLDLKGIESNLNALLINLNSAVSSLHMTEIHDDLTKVLDSADRLVSSADLRNDLVAIHTTLDQYRLAGEKLNNHLDPRDGDVTKTLAEAERALTQVRGAAQNMRIQLGPDAPLPNNLEQMLRQLSDALQSLSEVLDFMKQHPNALVTGREQAERRP
jgi:phospholipid/cholesterol/gamma-HCH transport system substrate-binding protein